MRKIFLLLAILIISLENLYSGEPPEPSRPVNHDCPMYNSFLKSDNALDHLNEKNIQISPNGILQLPDISFRVGNVMEFLKGTFSNEIDLTETYSFIRTHDEVSNVNRNVRYERYQQFYKGIKVEGGGYTAILKNNKSTVEDEGEILMIAPGIYDQISLDIHPKIMKNELDKIVGTEKIYNTELVIMPNLENDCQYHLVWKTYYFNGGDLLSIIDAEDGRILKTVNPNPNLQAPTQRYGNQDMVDQIINNYRVLSTNEDENGTIIKTYDMDGLSLFTLPQSAFSEDKIPQMDVINTEWSVTYAPENVYQAHWITQIIDQLYTESLGIDYGTIHIGANCFDSNAQAKIAYPNTGLGESYIVFGENFEGNTYAEFDIVAHEMGHVYLDDRELPYDSDADRSMHEGLADIFGVYIKHKYDQIENPNAEIDWIHGDITPQTNPRDLENPEYNCFTDVQNNGYAYARCQPLGYWFYLITEGVPEDCTNGGPLGIETAIDIVYEATKLLQSGDDYQGFKNDTYAAIDLLYGPNSNEAKTVRWAWEEICVDNEINDIQVWDGLNRVSGDIILKENAELTILNATLNMLPGTKIVVNPGSKLTVDNSTITICEAGTWAGIDLNSNANPNLTSELNIINNSEIQNAETGVYYEGNESLGILNCNGNSTFSNNGKAILIDESLNLTVSINSVNFIGNGIGLEEYELQDIVINDCIFTDNQKGIVTHNSDIELNYCNFNSNLTAVEMISSVNSHINSCNFFQYEGRSVKLERCGRIGHNSNSDERIIFELNSFNNADIGIDAFSSWFEVNNANTFEFCDIGINVMANQKSSFKVFDNNYFNGCRLGILMEGIAYTPFQVEISNNIFEDNIWSIVADGNNYFTINDNLNSLGSGVAIRSTSSLPNSVNCNDFFETNRGILVNEENTGVRILDNTYNNSNNYDMFLSDAHMHPTLSFGTESRPALNIFTESIVGGNFIGGISMYPTFGSNEFNSYQEFDYYMPDEPVPNTDPIHIPENWKEYTDDQTEEECVFSPYNDPPLVTEQDIIDYCILLDQYLDDPENQALRVQVLRIQAYLIFYLSYIYDLAYKVNTPASWETLENFLKRICNDWYFKKRLFFYYMNQRECVKADSVLNEISLFLELPPRNNRLDDYIRSRNSSFVNIQRIGLRYECEGIESGYEDFEFTQAEVSILETESSKSIPESAYARSLYYLATNILLDKAWLELQPPLPPGQLSLSDNISDESFIMKAFPNPANNEFVLHIENIDEIIGEIIIQDVLGNVNFRQILAGEHEVNMLIDVSEYPESTYILSFIDGAGKKIHSEKIFITKEK